ncbi:tyrosine-type recombinase/integrase [Methylobacterium planeticum]|uniref:tyrosine-type recombinase/integrase n=1 Tax=Methylobacterium planeticum TaxID=2615211 RepID=UPI00177DAF90|nr:tyrosine-type recombinase/integrase [Methylobacterium planeticum]
MPKVVLTVPFIRSATCPLDRKKTDYFDRNFTGFLLEVRASGRKTFHQRYSDERGRERQFKIGPADVLSLEQAKRKAQAIRAEAFLGSDPQRKRQAIRVVPTLAQLIRDRYIPHIQGYRRSWRSDEITLRLHALPKLGSLYLDEVTAEHVVDVVRGMKLDGYSPSTTNRVIIVLRFAYNLARRWKLPGASENPVTGIKLAEEHHRERFLTEVETKRLVDALSVDTNRVAANAILLLLLTGARRNEIGQAQWSYVDWRRRTLLVPLSKSGKPRRITLNAGAVALLQSVMPVPGNPFIFPCQRTGRPSPTLFSTWNRVRTRAGLPDLRLHDLRHSFASFLINRGVSLYVVQKLLGHTQIKTTQRYSHLAQETLQSAAEAAGTLVDEAATNRLNGSLLESAPTQLGAANETARGKGRSEPCPRSTASKPANSLTDTQRPSIPEMKKLRREGGRLLRLLREERGLSQRELCAMVGGGAYTFISQLETGRGRVPPDKLRVWAEALGLPPAEFAKMMLAYYDPASFEILFGDDEVVIVHGDTNALVAEATKVSLRIVH